VSKKQRLGKDFVSHREPLWVKLRTDYQMAAAGMALIEHLQSANGLQAICSVVAAYLLGCFATGYYLVRARTGRDIREIESGSTGARNVGRVLGKPGFVLTVFGDFGKGALAVWFAAEFTNHNGLAMSLAVLAVVAGQIWPAQLRFRGGKGVATSFAALSAGLRLRLVEMGLDLIGNGANTSPAVITIALPPEMNSVKIGEAMQESGYLLSCNSGYLRRKNWIQICLMGEGLHEKIVPVANALHRVCSRGRTKILEGSASSLP
jgi:hypothetical protein